MTIKLLLLLVLSMPITAWAQSYDNRHLDRELREQQQRQQNFLLEEQNQLMRRQLQELQRLRQQQELQDTRIWQQRLIEDRKRMYGQ